MRSGEKVLEVEVLPDGRLDAKNASVYVGLSPKTLATMRCNRKGPRYVKLGRIFYFIEDLDEWIQAGRATSTSMNGRQPLSGGPTSKRRITG